VTSLAAELGRPVSVQDMTGPVEQHLAEVLGATSWRRSASLADPAFAVAS
jgi:hypothetical protein